MCVMAHPVRNWVHANCPKIFVLTGSVRKHKCFKKQNRSNSEQISNPVSVAFREPSSISETNIVTSCSKSFSSYKKSTFCLPDTVDRLLPESLTFNSVTSFECSYRYRSCLYTKQATNTGPIIKTRYGPVVLVVMDHHLQNTKDKVWGNNFTKSIKLSHSSSTNNQNAYHPLRNKKIHYRIDQYLSLANKCSQL